MVALGAFTWRSSTTTCTLHKYPGPGFKAFLAKRGAISEDLRRRLLGWLHSGFSVHDRVRVGEEDAEGRQKLAGYRP